MPAKVKIYDRYGNEIDDEGRIVKDKHAISVPMILMDGRAIDKFPAPPAFNYSDARPRSPVLTDAERDQRRQVYAAYEDRISNAWRSPEPEDDE